MTAWYSCDGMLSRTMQLLMVRMMMAPMITPTTVPRPPNRLVPPTTAAVIVSKVVLKPPSVGTPIWTREVSMTAARAAMPLQMAKQETTMRGTRTPERPAVTRL